MPMKTWMSVKDVAKELEVSGRTVRRWISSRRLGAVRTSARRGRIRISREDLAEFLAGAKV